MKHQCQKPSAYSLAYWLIKDKATDPNLLFYMIEIFWPTFIEKDGYVFLKEAFSEEEYHSLVDENSSPEYWMNILTIDEFFSEMDDWDENSTLFAKTLVTMWEEKLKSDFPEKSFTVQYLCDEEYGDCGLTFFQTAKNPLHGTHSLTSEIPHPNIKETKTELSPSGPRPGIPQIRKARFDEVPKKPHTTFE